MVFFVISYFRDFVMKYLTFTANAIRSVIKNRVELGHR